MQPPISTSVVSEYENYTYSTKNVKDKKILALSKFHGDSDCSIYSKLLERENPNPKESSLGCTESSQLKLQNMNKSKDFNDETNHIKSRNKIPTPYLWSPSMSKSLNPSISITPEKPYSTHSDFNKFYSGNNYEEHVLNRVPQPAAWSPGMVVKPNPALFITPDKSSKNVDGDSPEYDYDHSVLILKTVDHAENVNSGNKNVKIKEKQCVRFDLPSASSGEETLDEHSSSESPITLKGSEMNNCSSPVRKPFSLQKNYNPNDYSDDSVLDDSTLNSSVTYFNTSPIFKTSQVVKVIQSDAPVNTQQKLVEGTSRTTELKTALNQQKKTNSFTTLKAVPLDKSIAELTKSHAVLSKPNSQNKKGEKPQHITDELKFPRSLSEPSLTPALIVVREERGKFSSTEYSYPFDSRAVGGDCEYEHVFARPEFNSTLKLRSELDSMHSQEVDALSALEEVLAKSETKRAELNEKAASCTNRRSNQFRDLVDLDPSVETLCERVVRMRTSKLPNKAKSTKVDKKTAENAPDLLEFFTSDLQKEAPDLSMPGLVPVSAQLAIAPHEVAFDLYRHNRMWLGINDFY